MLGTSHTRVALWGTPESLHVDPACPVSPSSGQWLEVSDFSLSVACQVCAQRRLAIQFAGTSAEVATSRLALCSDLLTESVSSAALGDGSALCDAGQALVLASTSARELEVASPFHAARRTIGLLRLRHAETFFLALARRAVAGSPLAQRSTTFPATQPDVVRTVRWAVRHGIDPVPVSLAAGQTAAQAETVVAALEDAARLAVATPTMLVLGSATSLPSGAIPELLSSSGALGDLLGGPGAVILPAGVLSLLNSASPGIRLAVAGAAEVAEATTELLDLTAQLWSPSGHGVTDAAAALAVARGLVS